MPLNQALLLFGFVCAYISSFLVCSVFVSLLYVVMFSFVNISQARCFLPVWPKQMPRRS